ncbi:hypothetical protein [Amycolatopsis acidicola]|uniref:hypothetical protein n=1 Tax=Amycolatopsis acidicola TaxID=2596893 RepID=UPI00124784A8|nr:hypothetical protein [Amycolatopsis acidicola]
MELTPRRVLTYEPRVGLSASHDPLEVPAYETTRDRLVARAVIFGLVSAGLLALAAVGDWRPAAVTGAVMVVLVTALTFWALFGYLLPSRKYLDLPVMALSLGEGELLVSGRRVSVAVPGVEPRWIVARLPRPYRVLLAGERRLFLLGPNARGRVLIALPGMFRTSFGRVRTEPHPGSEILPGVSRTFGPAAQDPVMTAFVRAMWQSSVAAVVVFVLAAVPLIAVDLTEDAALAAAMVPVDAVFAVLTVLILLRLFARNRLFANAVRSQPWNELPAALDAPIKLHPLVWAVLRP